VTRKWDEAQIGATAMAGGDWKNAAAMLFVFAHRTDQQQFRCSTYCRRRIPIHNQIERECVCSRGLEPNIKYNYRIQQWSDISGDVCVI
jgi:hypothetical protein